MSDQFAEIRDHFLAALERDGLEAQLRYAAEHCADNPGLQEKLGEMLRAHHRPEGFLASRVEPTHTGPIAETAGSVVGPYKLLQQIGEGGFGVVYMAEQTEPVRRKVALKIIKPGMDTKEVIARFEAERQALALMDHPNIARVLDAGATESGRPYFVMELVKGVPITDYCDQNQFTPRQRLELFVAVCQAVQHAHQKGIIHRDIKPTNVLVTQHDDKPLVKVIDFGIAKATSGQLTDKTLFTGYAQLVGTPLYMSPEQAALSAIDIDTRSDIYSLGVLLYELLTGTTPFDKTRLQQAAFEEVRRIIREEEPQKPSTRLSSLGATLPSVSAVRKTEPRKLSQLVRGDLDWIVMKALEKDRARRYETANGFAADVLRYLADEPITACPPSTVYRFRKFARRNKAALGVAALVLFFLVLLGSGAGWALRDRAAREVEVARERDERHARLTAQVETILDDVERLEQEGKWADALSAARRAESVLASSDADAAFREQARQAVNDLELVRRLELIRMEQSSFRDGKFDYAGAVRDYARAFREFGVDVESMPTDEVVARLSSRRDIALPLAAALDDCVHARRQALGWDEPGWASLVAVARELDSEPLRDYLRATWGQKVTPEMQAQLRALAETLDVRRQPPGALYLLAKTLGRVELDELQEQVLRQAQWAYPADFWLNLELGFVLDRTKDYDDAMRFDSAAVALQPASAAAHHNLGVDLFRRQKLVEAEACYRRAIELDPMYAAAHTSLGNLLYSQRKLDEAGACYRRAIEIDATSASAHDMLGNVLSDQNKLDEAEVCHRRAIELDPTSAKAHNNLGVVLLDLKRLDEAEASLLRAIELDPAFSTPHNNLGNLRCAQHKLDEADASYQRAIKLNPASASAHDNLGNLRYTQHKLDEAEACARRAIELDPKHVPAHNNLGTVLCDLKRLEEAEACFRLAIELDPAYAKAWGNLGVILRQQKRLTEAEVCCRRAIGLDPAFARGWSELGVVLKEKQELDEAETCCRHAIELDADDASAHMTLGNVLYSLWRLDEAEACYQRAIELDPNMANAHVCLGTLLKNRRRLADAEACYRRAMELDATNVYALSGLGTVLWMRKDLEEAERCSRRAIELDPAHAGGYHSLGLVLEDRGKLDEAEASLRRAVDLEPTDPFARNDLGGVLRHQQKLAEAEASYRRAIELDPRLAAAHLNLGSLLRDQKKLEEAETSYRRAVELDPANARLHTDLGIVLCGEGKLEEAAACHRRAIELDPTLAGAHNNLGIVLRDQGKMDEAEACYRRSLELDPMYVNGHINLGDLLRGRGELLEAEARYRRAIELDPTRMYAYVILSRMMRDQGKLDEAEVLCRRAIALDPSYVHAWYALGNVLRDLKRLDEAEAGFRRAVELNPTEPYGHLNLGKILLDQGKPSESVVALRKTVELNPQLPVAWYRLGIAHYRAGNWEESITALERSCQLDVSTNGQGNAWEWLFLAMDHWQLGQQQEARTWYDKALELEKVWPEELRGYRDEAAKLLGIPDPQPPEGPM